MDLIPLKAAPRDQKVKVKALRRSGAVPAVVYGFEAQKLAIQCPEIELHKAFAKAGESTLVELEVEGKKIPVLFKEVQFDPITSRETHADFYAVNMKKEIETSVPIHLSGESLAVKDLAGILVTPLTEVRVRCLPADLPHSLTVDISPLKEFHNVVSVKDLTLPKGVTVMNAPETVLATVQEPRAEEVVEVAAPVEGAPVEGAAPSTEGAPAAAAEGGAPGAAPAATAEKAPKEKAGKEKK